MNAPPNSDVHTAHCCARHGCKYRDDTCTVTTGGAPQQYACESCAHEAERLRELVADRDLFLRAIEEGVRVHGLPWVAAAAGIDLTC